MKINKIKLPELLLIKILFSIALLLVIFYLFMKISNMKIDFSRTGITEVASDKYRQCLKDYTNGHILSFDEWRNLSLEERNKVTGYDYCVSTIPIEERNKKVFRFPRIYFLPPGN